MIVHKPYIKALRLIGLVKMSLCQYWKPIEILLMYLYIVYGKDGYMESKKITLGLFYLYFLAVVWIILFKMQFSFQQFGVFRSINLIPFAESVIINDRLNVSEMIGNVLIFLPYGVFVCMLGREGLCFHSPSGSRVSVFFMQLAPIFFTSIALEVLQYVFAAGASDITDLITNTAGGAAGIGIYGIFLLLFKDKADRILNAVLLAGAAGMVLFIGILIMAN